jgi:DNA-binding response OmpR family regulator
MSWSEIPVELRSKYRRAAAMTVAQLARLVNQLDHDPGDVAALKILLRRFHGLAGWGGQYGLAPISVAAQLGEHDCTTLLGGNVVPDRRHLDQIHALIPILRRTLRDQGQPATPREQDEMAIALPPHYTALLVGPWAGALAAARSELLDRGIAARWVETSYDAGRALGAGLPDALIAAAQLPDGTGYVLTDYLRGLAGGSQPIVLVVGAKGVEGGEAADAELLLGCGADAAPDPPGDWQAVAALLERLLDRRDAGAARILCLAADGGTLLALRELLDAAGHRVRCCTDPRRLPRDVASFAPDLLLLDVPQPDWITNDLVRRLRLDRQAAAVPLLFLTSESGAPAAVPQVVGAEYLARPFDSARLLGAVAARIERSRALKRLFTSAAAS